MAQNISFLGASYSNVPAVTLPKTGGGTARFTDVTDTTAVAGQVAEGAYFYNAAGERTEGTATGGSMVIRDEADSHGGTIRHITAGTVVTGTTSITENGSYDVAQYADAVVNVPAPAPSLQSKTATPTESQQTVTPDAGYDGLSSVSVGAISSTYVGSGITRRSSTDLTASGATVTVPAGYYSAQASKAVASGTAGTPTATKGAVSNHSVSVTPSVTNTAGYITGGTKTGTAASVSASELVSGTLSITSSGTKDVTNYASASVAAGIATASATKGTVSNHSVTVTPTATRTAGYVTAGSSNGTAVTVSASELVSGTLSITESGTHDVTNYASVDVDVGGGGGTIVTGTFTTGGTRAAKETVSINYAGSGYPLAYVVYCSSVSANYDVNSFSAVKNTASEPSWTTAADGNNTSTATYIYRNSQIWGTLNTNAASHMGAQYTPAAGANCVKFIGSGATLGYYIGNGTSTTQGLAPSTTYNYLIVYSS